MPDGLGGIDGFWQAQTELAKQVSSLAQQVGHITAQISDRVTHKDLMTEFGGFRKEFTGKLDHMEGKFDDATERVEDKLDRAVDRIKDNLAGLTAKAVDEAMTARRARELEAQTTINNREADIDRRLRRADRNAAGGIGFGLIAGALALAQAMGWIGG